MQQSSFEGFLYWSKGDRNGVGGGRGGGSIPGHWGQEWQERVKGKATEWKRKEVGKATFYKGAE